MNNDQVVFNETVLKFNTPNKNGRIYSTRNRFGYKLEVDDNKINEWFIDCLQAEISRREQEFDYLRTLPASKIACIKDHAAYLVTLEAYIQQLKNLVKTHGGRSNAAI